MVLAPLVFLRRSMSRYRAVAVGLVVGSCVARSYVYTIGWGGFQRWVVSGAVLV